MLSRSHHDTSGEIPNYRRNRVSGGTYFFTVALLDRQSNLLVEDVAALRHAVSAAKRRRPFHIDAWVVLPDHLHAIWTLPDDDFNFSQRWHDIKTVFSKSIARTEARTPVMRRRGERGIWQPRFWEHTIRDERDYAAHMDYVHFNPVKHGLVDHPAKWPYSSLERCIARGIYEQQWGSIHTCFFPIKP